MKFIHWGILSTARINRRLIPEIRAAESCELTGIASRDLTKASEYATQWEIPRAYGSYEDLLEDSEIDIVYISLPNDLHALWTIRALFAGKHVLCEKPLCLTQIEMQEITRVSKETGFVAMEAFMYMHHPQTHLFKQLLHDNLVGEMIGVSSEFTAMFSRPLDNYRMSAEQGGGALWDIGVYPVSFFHYLIDTSVTGVSAKARIVNGIDMDFWGRLDFASGVSGQFFVSFESIYSTRTSVFGSEGRLDITHPYNATDECHAYHCTETETSEIMLPKKNLYAGEVENMNAIARGAAKPAFTLQDSATVLESILRLRKAAGLPG